MAKRAGAELAVHAEGLAKTYRGRVQALKGVDLDVPVGSAFGLLGPNGAGKSTLVKCLLSIVHPTGGRATILGRDIRDAEARHGVGYLPEGHRFPRYLTGRGVCEYFGKLAGLTGSKLAEDIDDKLALVGMKDWASTRITKYSKGMAQRIGLAQAMLGEPKVVFLDEPTDGVDPVGRHQIREVIKGLCRGGTTVFLNSHLLQEVEQVCDRVAIMHHGQILQQGTVDEIRAAVRGDQTLLRVRFTTTGLTNAQLSAVHEAFGPPPSARGSAGDDGGPPPTFDLELEKESLITDVIDHLRSERIGIVAVEPQRGNLESAFIDLISAQEDQGVGASRP